MNKSGLLLLTSYYFDFLHAEGGFPNLGNVVQGKTVDLFEWMLKGLKKRGFGAKTIGVDSEFPPSKFLVLSG